MAERESPIAAAPEPCAVAPARSDTVTPTEPSVRVSEIFTSIQGEGASVGTPSVFVRLQGCTVGCAWCDTKYSWDPRRGEELALEALLRRVEAASARNVVVTGGEPLEHPAFAPLVRGLAALGLRVEVETAGTQVPPAVPVDQWNVSLKLAHSDVPLERRLCPAAIERFRELGAWFKFVVGEECDVAEVVAIQSRYGLSAEHILLMPLGMRREEQQALMPRVVDWCRQHGFRFSPRLHILIWGPRRGV
jgi:organic radical activating enzyme